MPGMLMSYVVKVGFDESERRYFVIDSDLPGLHIEADSFEEFVEAVQEVAPDLVGAHPEGCRLRFEREVALTG